MAGTSRAVADSKAVGACRALATCHGIDGDELGIGGTVSGHRWDAIRSNAQDCFGARRSRASSGGQVPGRRSSQSTAESLTWRDRSSGTRSANAGTGRALNHRKCLIRCSDRSSNVLREGRLANCSSWHPDARRSPRAENSLPGSELARER